PSALPSTCATASGRRGSSSCWPCSGWRTACAQCPDPAPRAHQPDEVDARGRRYSMKREIYINAAPRETRVAILEDGQLVELLVDRPDNRRMVGDIYLGKVEAVLPGIQAAFVDIGTEKSAFLHASDLVFPEDEESGDDDEDDEEDDDPDPTAGRSRGSKGPPIQ